MDYLWQEKSLFLMYICLYLPKKPLFDTNRKLWNVGSSSIFDT